MSSTQVRFSAHEDHTEAVARGFKLTMLIPTAGGLYASLQQASDSGVQRVGDVDTQTFSVRDDSQARVAELVVQNGVATLNPWRPLTQAERSLGAESFSVRHLGIYFAVVATEAGTWAVRLTYPAAFSEHDVDLGVALSATRAVVEVAAEPVIEAGVEATMKNHTDSIAESLLESAALALVLATRGQYAPRNPGQETTLPGEGRALYERALSLRQDLSDFTEGLLQVAKTNR